MLRHFAAGLCPALALCAALSTSPGAQAQTTDGFHAIQVLPVVVDTASFTQRINFRTQEVFNVTLQVDYYPADGTAQATPIRCNDVLIPGEGDAVAASLLSLCPGLAAGSNFGTLVFRSNTPRIFSVYSRVSNAMGAGFSVEGFAANNFSSAVTSVTGLRRAAATANSPAYQTNCFIGNLAELTPGAGDSISVGLSLIKDELQIGSTQVSLPPGRLVRLLDVFGVAGVPAGDVQDATALFTPTPGTTPALITFCTVQDNTSFGADFRIGKVELGLGFLPGWQDNDKIRNAVVSGDYMFSGEVAPRKFTIPAGATRNVHTFYFQHPDVISCEIRNANTNALALSSYGLEMRLLGVPSGSSGWQVLAGGNDVISFSNFYLGDKIDQGNGSSTRYLLEVESNGQNEGAERLYKLRCQSGSGHTFGEIALSGAPVAF